MGAICRMLCMAGIILLVARTNEDSQHYSKTKEAQLELNLLHEEG